MGLRDRLAKHAGKIGIVRGDVDVKHNTSRSGVDYHKYIPKPRYLWYSENGPAKRVTDAQTGERMYVPLASWQGKNRG